MNTDKRRESWRNFHNQKISKLAPDELEEFRARKAEYDRVYRREQAAKREAYRKDPMNMEKARIAANLRYHAKVAGKPKRVPFTEEEKRERAKACQMRPHVVERRREYAKKNRDKINKAWNAKYHSNPKAVIARNGEYSKKRRKVDVNYRIISNMRAMFSSVLRGHNKSKRTMELLGCTIEQFRAHLESQFKDGMTWDNYGYKGWHVDHLTPCTHFNMALESDQRKCFHWTNLAPLWGTENSRKGNRYVSPPIGQIPMLPILTAQAVPA